MTIVSEPVFVNVKSSACQIQIDFPKNNNSFSTQNQTTSPKINSMSTNFETVKELLPKLSLDELHTVIDSCKALKQFARNKDTHTESGGPHDIVLSALYEVMANIGSDLPDIPLIKRSFEYPAFKRKCIPIIEFFKPVGTKNEQFAALCLGIELLHRNLNKMRLPATSKRIMRLIHMVPSVVNQSFPEYAKCGLLHLIIRKKEKA